MLRVNVKDGAELTSLIVEGKLIKPWVREFEACWRKIQQHSSGKAIEVDLGAVSFIDDDGRALLSEMCQQGVRIITNGLLIKAIICEIKDHLKCKKSS